MPAKAGSQRQAAQSDRGNNAADSSPKKRKVSQTDSEKKGPGVSFEVYHSEAGTFQGIGEFRKAINSYTRALEIRPTDKNCLIARAQCYQQLGEADKALADANETLKEDPKYIKGLLMKAEAYYQMMYFEYALMYYHRGNKLRPEVQAFRLGIQKSQEAIENSIGERSGVHLENKGDLTFFYEEQLQQQQKQKKATSTFTKPAAKTEEKIERKQRTTCTDPKTVKELLGELYTDKQYLEKLLHETESASNQSDTNKAIRTLAVQGLDYLDTRTEFWQQQKPMYSRRRDRQLREEARQQAAAEVDKAKDPTQWILRKLEEIDDAQANGQYEESLRQSKRLMKDLNKWQDSEVRNRNEFLANAHSCLGNAYLETGNYTKALENHEKDYNLAKQHKMPDAKSRALDNLGRVHARMGNFDKAIQVWEKKLPTTKSALENTWLYHEIGRCHLEMNQPAEAKEFGEKSLEAAQEAEDELWQLNASVLIAQANVKLGELDAAVESFNAALELAKVQTDRAAENAIRRAIDDINNTITKQTQHKSRQGSGVSQPRSAQSHDNSNERQEDDDEPREKPADTKDNTSVKKVKIDSKKQKEDTKKKPATSGKDAKDTDSVNSTKNSSKKAATGKTGNDSKNSKKSDKAVEKTKETTDKGKDSNGKEKTKAGDDGGKKAGGKGKTSKGGEESKDKAATTNKKGENKEKQEKQEKQESKTETKTESKKDSSSKKSVNKSSAASPQKDDHDGSTSPRKDNEDDAASPHKDDDEGSGGKSRTGSPGLDKDKNTDKEEEEE